MIRVDLSSDSRARLHRLERDCPRTMRAAFGAAATRAQRRLRKAMRQGGGVYGVERMAPHSEISTCLRPGQKMGGKLAQPRVIVKYKIDADTQYIGWPDALAKWASRFQDSASRPMTEAQRKWMHFRGIKDAPVCYTRPERDVIDSFSGNLAGEWPGMVLAMFDKYYRSRMAKYGRVS